MKASSPMPSLDFCLQASRAHASLQRRLDDELGTLHGMGYADFIVLRELGQAGGGRLRTADLVAPLGVPLSGVVRRLLPMEKTGWVARESGAVQLRPAGRAAQAEAAATADAICAEALEGLDAQTLARTAAVLQHLRASPALVPR